ncbi:MAG: DUF3108 domain-containing protein [Candidatus Kryptoniota bacterium]
MSQTTDGEKFRTVINDAFKVGESLNYGVYYGPVRAGTAEISVPALEYVEGRRCYRIEFSLTSAKFFDIFYKVRDKYVTILDAQGLFPWRFEQHIREGGYKHDFIAWFNQLNHTAMTSEGGPYPIKPYTQDIVSVFFYARTLDFTHLKIGEKIHFENFYDNKVYPLDVKYLGVQDVETKAGKFHCQIIEPIIVEGGLFRTKGRIVAWLSDDRQRIPVKVQAEVLIGSVNAELESYSGLTGNPASKF